MPLEILTSGHCRPLGFPTEFPARHLRWHSRGLTLAIDAGYGPALADTWSEKLYSALFRVHPGVPLAPADDVLITHYHLDHVGGVGAVSCCGPALPVVGSSLWQLRHATFARSLPRQLRVLPSWTHQRFGFPAVAWHDLEVIHLPGHTANHTGVYFPALHLLYVCDAVWHLAWLQTGRVPLWAACLQEDRAQFLSTFRQLCAVLRADPSLRVRCAHDPASPIHEHIAV